MSSEPDAPENSGQNTVERGIALRLEQEFGFAQALGGGFQSRVFSVPDPHAPGHDLIVKVYRENLGLNRLEAFNMVRAGLGAWVVGARNLDGLELLELRRFPGEPLEGPDIAPSLPSLAGFLRELHARTGFEAVNLAGVRAKLTRFRRSLPEMALGPLFALVGKALHSGLLEVESRLCHLDLHRANILVSKDGQLLVVDWTRSDWDDPARDLAIFFTGTLDQLPIEDAVRTAIDLARHEGVLERLAAYVALQTLHDLYWFRTRSPEGFDQAFSSKLPRALALFEHA